jgi:hypothetical protein
MLQAMTADGQNGAKKSALMFDAPAFLLLIAS